MGWMYKFSLYSIVLSIFLFTVSLVQAKNLSMAEVQAKLAQLRKESPNTKCTKESDWQACIELFLDNDRDLYYEQITKDLTVEKKIALSNYFIDYVLNNNDISLDDTLSENEKRMRIGLHREKFLYGTLNRVPRRLSENIFSYNLKSSNFLRYISTSDISNPYKYLRKSATQIDDVPNERYGRLIAKTYYEKLVHDISCLPDFYDNVLLNCGLCDKQSYLNKFLQLPDYGQNINPQSPQTSIEFNYIFKPVLQFGYVNEMFSVKYQNSIVTSVQEIPYFVDNVLRQCSDCNDSQFYVSLQKTAGFGETAKNFFESIEYRYVLKNLSPEEIADKYLEYAVDGRIDIPAFYADILDRFKTLKETEYYSRLIGLTDFGKDLEWERILDSVEYQYVLKKLNLKTVLTTRGQNYNITIKTGYSKNLSFEFKSSCEYAYAESQDEELGFFEAIFSGGASGKRVQYDVYNCSPNSESLNKIKRISSAISDMTAYRSLTPDGAWKYYKATSQELLYNSQSSTLQAQGEDMKNLCLSITEYKSMCYNIQNEDMKNLCLGITEYKNMCYNIQNEDMKNLCLAVAQGQETCYFIK